MYYVYPCIEQWIPAETALPLPRFLGPEPFPGLVPIPFALAAGGGPDNAHLRGQYVDPYTFRFL